MECLLIVLFSLLISYVMCEWIADKMVTRIYNQRLRLIIKKIMFYILVVYIIFISIKSLYGVYQYNNIYNEFKKTEITNNIDISTLKDNYILLEGKITSQSGMVQNEYIEYTNAFVYLEENKEHYGNKTGWETDNTSIFYSDNVSVGNILINLKTFNINNSEGIRLEDIKEPYKKYYNQNLYFNKSDGSIDKRITYKVLRNNDDVLIFSKVKDGQLVSLSSMNDSLIFAGGDNYKKLDTYLKESAKQDISYLEFIGVAILVLVLYYFRKSKIFSKLWFNTKIYS